MRGTRDLPAALARRECTCGMSVQAIGRASTDHLDIFQHNRALNTTGKETRDRTAKMSVVRASLIDPTFSLSLFPVSARINVNILLACDTLRTTAAVSWSFFLPRAVVCERASGQSATPIQSDIPSTIIYYVIRHHRPAIIRRVSVAASARKCPSTPLSLPFMHVIVHRT